MKVAFTLGGTDNGRSGLSTYVRAVLPEFVREARDANLDVVVLGTQKEFAVYGEAVGNTERCVLPSWADSAAGSAIFYLLLASHRAKKAGADVVLYTAANRRIGVLPGIPSVAVVHDLGQLHIEGKYDLLRMAYAKIVVIGSLRAATRLVAISEATRRDLESALKRSNAASPSQSVDVVLNGIDAKRFVPLKADAPEVLAARTATGIEGPYILYVGRLEHPGKNHLRLIRAFAKSRVRDSHCLVLVGAEWGARAMLEQEIERLGLVERVSYVGFVATEHLAPLVAAADAVAMVGLREGFGLPALEALATGRPVFCSNTGALPEVVGDLAAQCDPFDERSILEAMERSVFDKGLRQRIEEEGPSYAAEHGWNRTARGLLRSCIETLASAG